MGFGDAGAHLPQPEAFAAYAVEVEEADSTSTLSLYRRALALRRRLMLGPDLSWHDDAPGVLHFVRPGGWHCLANFGASPHDLPEGQVLVSSAPLVGDSGRQLAPDAAAWVSVDGVAYPLG